MTDVVDAKTRSRMMSGIRGKNTKPELIVRKYLHAAGFRYRLHAKDLPGKPDIVLPKYSTAIFVHGCFWHQHKGCKLAVMPKSNNEFWSKKLASNIKRDNEVLIQLGQLGWSAQVIWECDLDNSEKLEQLAEVIKATTK